MARRIVNKPQLSLEIEKPEDVHSQPGSSYSMSSERHSNSLHFSSETTASSTKSGSSHSEKSLPTTFGDESSASFYSEDFEESSTQSRSLSSNQDAISKPSFHNSTGDKYRQTDSDTSSTYTHNFSPEDNEASDEYSEGSRSKSECKSAHYSTESEHYSNTFESTETASEAPESYSTYTDLERDTPTKLSSPSYSNSFETADSRSDFSSRSNDSLFQRFIDKQLDKIRNGGSVIPKSGDLTVPIIDKSGALQKLLTAQKSFCSHHIDKLLRSSTATRASHHSYKSDSGEHLLILVGDNDNIDDIIVHDLPEEFLQLKEKLKLENVIQHLKQKSEILDAEIHAHEDFCKSRESMENAAVFILSNKHRIQEENWLRTIKDHEINMTSVNQIGQLAASLPQLSDDRNIIWSRLLKRQ